MLQNSSIINQNKFSYKAAQWKTVIILSDSYWFTLSFCFCSSQAGSTHVPHHRWWFPSPLSNSCHERIHVQVSVCFQIHFHIPCHSSHYTFISGSLHTHTNTHTPPVDKRVRVYFTLLLQNQVCLEFIHNRSRWNGSELMKNCSSYSGSTGLNKSHLYWASLVVCVCVSNLLNYSYRVHSDQ